MQMDFEIMKRIIAARKNARIREQGPEGGCMGALKLFLIVVCMALTADQPATGGRGSSERREYSAARQRAGYLQQYTNDYCISKEVGTNFYLITEIEGQ